MPITISPQLRLILLVGVIAAVGLACAMFLLSRGSDESVPPAPLSPSPSSRSQAAQLPIPASTRTTAVPARAKPARAKPARAKEARKRPAVARDTGLPIAVTRALRRRAVVVVALYARGAAVDRLARAEAKAGARDARAGFVALDVADRRQIEPLVEQSGVAEAPALLVFRRPGRLAARFDGFADRVVVAQAVADARR